MHVAVHAPSKKGTRVPVHACSWELHSLHQRMLVRAVQMTQVSPDALTRNGLTLVLAVHCANGCHPAGVAGRQLE